MANRKQEYFCPIKLKKYPWKACILVVEKCHGRKDTFLGLLACFLKQTLQFYLPRDIQD